MILLLALQILLPVGTYTVGANTTFQIVVDQDIYNTEGWYLVVDEVDVQKLVKTVDMQSPIAFNHRLPVGLYRVRIDAYAQKSSQNGFGFPVFYSETRTVSRTIHVYASPKPVEPRSIIIR
jgi:hypothetical protein